MRRREFLSTMPLALQLPGRGATGDVSPQTVSIIVVGFLHPHAWRSINKLIGGLRQIGYSAAKIEGASEAVRNAHRIIVAVAEDSNLEELRQMGWESRKKLLPEGFELNAKPGILFALGADSRGVVYALSHLERLIKLERRLPASLVRRRNPLFATRRWSTAVSHNFGSPWDERIHLAQRFAYIKSEVLPRATDYGMNSIELNGRPGDGWDIDWIISFEGYPELAHLFAPGVRRERLALVEDLARSAHDNLLEILVWNHELHLPPGFVDLYPQVRGIDYPVCLSSEFLKQFLRSKYIEFFRAAPSVDGVIISVNESGQFSLLTDAGCRCDRCILMKQHDRLMAILNEVIAVTSKLRKQVVLRTFQSATIHDLYGHPELETIRKAYTGLPNHVQIMSKYCPLDFYGGEIPDEPLIGAFPNPHLVEFSLDVEWQGRTFVPALTPENFRRRIAHALRKKCSGVVARIDFPFPSMEPESIFGHPNEYNAYYMGDLLWDTPTGIDASLWQWAQLRYGSDAAQIVSSALRKTEAITQKTFFTLGQTLINYHNMLAGISFCDNSLWNHALSKWDESKRNLSESFFKPDEDLIKRARIEKEEALQLASEGLSQIAQAREKMTALDYQRLHYDFEKLRDSAELWLYLLELYLRHRQIAFSPVKPDLLQTAISLSSNERLQHLLEAAQKALVKGVEMELRHGKESWPVVSPDRGVSAYEFVNQILRHYIAALTGEPTVERVVSKSVDQVFTAPVYQPDSVENLWRRLVECGRPGFEIGNTLQVRLKWPEKLRKIHINDLGFALLGRGDHSLRFPLSYNVGEISLAVGSDVVLSVLKTPSQLLVTQANLQPVGLFRANAALRIGPVETAIGIAAK